MKKLVASISGRDIAGIAGAALISAGTGLIYLPAGFIVAGSLLLAGALLMARAEQ